MDNINVPAPLDPAQLQADLAINPLDLTDGMMRQAALFAHYSRLAAQAERLVGKIEQIQSVVEARLDKEVRDAAAAEGRKITEAQVKNLVISNPKYIKVVSALNEAQMNANLAKSAADSFRHRRDMLIQLAFNAREEAKGELRISGNAGLSGVRAAAAEFQRDLRRRTEESSGN